MDSDASKPSRNAPTILIIARRLGGPLLVIAMLAGSIWLLRRELGAYHFSDFWQGLKDISPLYLWAAVGLTVLNYVVLMGYDYLGTKYIQHPLSPQRIALASFLGYAVGHNFGALLGGWTIRFRLYSAWGLSYVEIVKLVALLGVTFWIGLFALAAVVFLVQPTGIPDRLHAPIDTTFPLGIVFALAVLWYLAICATHRTPLRIWKWSFSPPPLPLALVQLGLAAIDLAIAASVLYVLLPETVVVSFPHFLSIYLLALVAGFISQVPGGLGVLELTVIVLLDPVDPEAVVSCLLAYRVIYFLLPLVVGLVLLTGHEIAIHRGRR